MQAAPHVPEALEQSRELEFLQVLATSARAVERRAHVVDLVLEPSTPDRLDGSTLPDLSFPRQIHEEALVQLVELGFSTGGATQLGSELSDRLEHPEPLAGVPDEALVDERLENVEVGGAHLLGCLECAATLEDRQTSEQLLFLLAEQVVRPLDRCAQRLLPRVLVAAALQQVETLRQPFEDLRWREHARPGGRQLDGQWHVVEPAAELADILRGLESGARAEELHGLVRGERRHRVFDLAVDPQEFAARNKHVQIE